MPGFRLVTGNVAAFAGIGRAHSLRTVTVTSAS